MIGQVPFEFAVPVNTPGTCYPVPPPAPGWCYGQDASAILVDAPVNATVLAIRIELGRLMLGDSVEMPEAVSYEVRCEDDRNLTCARPLAQGVTTLPATVALDDLKLNAGAKIELELTSTGRDPAVDVWLRLIRTVQVTGSATLAWGPAHAREISWIPIDVRGTSGPCLQEANCTGSLGGSTFVFEDAGHVAEFDLVMTWTATSALDKELELTLACHGCQAPEPSPLSVFGPSPLNLKVAGVGYEGFSLQVSHGSHDVPTTPGFDSPHGSRTPVHIVGTIGIADAA